MWMHTDWGLGVLCRLVALTSTHTHTHTQAVSQSGLVLTHIQPGALGKRGKQSCILKRNPGFWKTCFRCIDVVLREKVTSAQFHSRLFISLHFWCWREKWVPRPGLLVQMLLGFCRSAFTNWQKVTLHARIWRAFRWFCRDRVVNGKKPAISLLYLMYLVRFSSHGRGWLYCWTTVWELLMHEMIM